MALMVVTFTAAQTPLDDVKWFELNPPNIDTDGYETKNLAVDILDNGNIYLSYVNFQEQIFKVNKYDILKNEWVELSNYPINTDFGFGTQRLISYSNGQKVFYGINRTGEENLDLMTLIELDENENLTVHMENEPHSFYSPFKFDMTYDGINDIVYFSALNDNFSSVIYAFDPSEPGFNQVSLIQNTNAVPVIGIDEVNNVFFHVTTNTADEIIVYTGDLVANTANLTLNSQGPLNSNLFSNTPMAGDMYMVDKKGGAPDLIFILNLETAEDGTYRINLGDITGELSVSAYTQLFDPPFFSTLEVTGSGDNTYLYGAHGWQDPASALELLPDGTEQIVAELNEPYTLNPEGAEVVKIGSSSLIDRLAGYYREYGPAPEVPGRFTITNRPPSIQLISEVNQGCFSMSSTATFIDEILFSDPDGDVVEIIEGSVQSNTNGIVDATKNPNGSWQLYGNFDQPGEVQISFAYTDGLDTVNHQFNYDPGNPPATDFTQEQFSYCLNELPLQSSDLLNESLTGQFILDETFPTNEGDIIEENDLEKINFIAGDDIYLMYNYTDDIGCTYIFNTFLTIYDIPEVVMSVEPSTCDENNGSAFADVISANGNYSEYWSNGSQNTNSIDNLSPGTYYYNIEDDFGCKAVSQANIAAAGLTVDGAITPLSCHNGNDASINLDLTGFTNPTILWSTGHGSNSISALEAGTYEVTVWDNDDCRVTKSFTIANPPKFTVDFNAVSPSNCSAADGEISVLNENNATGNVTYEWTGGATGDVLSGLSSGVFKVEANDGTCTFNKTFTLNSPAGPFASANIVNTDCKESNGKITLNVTPATGEEITGFEWSNGQQFQNIAGLAPDIYTVDIAQTGGCISSYEFEVKTKRAPKPEICIVTVDTTTNTNLVVWEKPETDLIDYYTIYRETSTAGEFKKVGSVDYEEISVFNDVVASPRVRSWRYRIASVNHCGVESHKSAIHKTIHLVTQENGADVTVAWDNYEGFTFNSYSLLRYTNDFGWEVIEPNIAFASLPFYEDTPPSLDGLDYMIEVTPPTGLCTATFGKAQDYNSSRSNKPTGVFKPGDGTGDPHNSVASFENDDFSVAVYPNPSNGDFELELSHKLSNANLNMDIVDFNGKVIHAGQVQNGVNHIQLDNIQAGMYFVKLYDTTNSETIRIVVQ